MSKFIFHTNDTDMPWILVGILFCLRRSRLIKHSVNVIENMPCVPYDHFNFSLKRSTVKVCLKGIHAYRVPCLVDTEDISDAWYNNFSHMIANVWHVLNLLIILLFGYYWVYREVPFRCKLKRALDRY